MSSLVHVMVTDWTPDSVPVGWTGHEEKEADEDANFRILRIGPVDIPTSQ